MSDADGYITTDKKGLAFNIDQMEEVVQHILNELTAEIATLQSTPKGLNRERNLLSDTILNLTKTIESLSRAQLT